MAGDFDFGEEALCLEDALEVLQLEGKSVELSLHRIYQFIDVFRSFLAFLNVCLAACVVVGDRIDFVKEGFVLAIELFLHLRKVEENIELDMLDVDEGLLNQTLLGFQEGVSLFEEVVLVFLQYFQESTIVKAGEHVVGMLAVVDD